MRHQPNEPPENFPEAAADGDASPAKEASCDRVQEWLLAGSSPAESAAATSIQRHLRTCGRCQRFERHLSSYKKALDLSTEEAFPHPSTQARLRSELENRRTRRSVVGRMLRPVPIYQTILAVAAVVAVVLVMDQLGEPEKTPLNISVRETETDTFSPMEAIENIGKPGRTHAEDSLLVSLAVSS
jgi:hypothetical protein